MKNKKITAILLFLVFVVSIAGGIAFIKPANEQKAIYNEQIVIAQQNQATYEKLLEIDNPIISSDYTLNVYKTKALEAEEKASDAKSQMVKFFVGSALLVFVAFVMLGLLAVILVPKYVEKLPTVDEKEAEE